MSNAHESAFGPCLGDQLRELARIEGRVGAEVRTGVTRHQYGKAPSDLQVESARLGISYHALAQRRSRERRRKVRS
jgi:hypothetical protein